MSETATRPARLRPGRQDDRRKMSLGTLILLGVLLVLLAVPFYADVALLQTGLLTFSAIVAAIGLNLLTGTTGQLSLAHAFFVAVGAYGYSYFTGVPTAHGPGGLGLPPLAGLVLGVLLAGLTGMLFSPVAARLGGVYLGIASLALIFIGHHVMFSATPLTGGFNGRSVVPFDIAGFSFTESNPNLSIFNVSLGQYERLWYFGLALAVLAYIIARNIVRRRPGRALTAIRDSELAAAVLGINVGRYKASAFIISSMYAGLGGVIFALTVGHVVPDSFNLQMTIDYLAAIVIGGLGSVTGAAVGATFVFAIPQFLNQYSASIPFLAAAGSSGDLGAGSAARYLYGLAVVVVILAAPGGLADIARRRTGRRSNTTTAPKVRASETPDGKPTTPE